jgi:hypothetical protein
MDANTTWKQIGLMTKMACGAREAKYSPESDALTFKVGGGARCAYIKITLNPMDYYDLVMYRIRANKVTELDSREDIDCEQLSECIYHMVNK